MARWSWDDASAEPSLRLQALSNYASEVEAEPQILPGRYFRSGREMLRMAKVYRSEGQLENSFILYSKFITLFVEKLPKHPDYKDNGKSPPSEKKTIRELVVSQAFPHAERLKTSLKTKFEKQYAVWQDQEKKRLEELAKEMQELKLREDERRKVESDRSKQDEQYAWQLMQDEARARQLEQEGIPPPSYNSVVGPPSVQPSAPSAPPAPPVQSALNGDDSLAQDWQKSQIEPPRIDRSIKPSHFMSVGIGGDNKYGLRDIRVPADLTDKFLKIAQSNTSQNIEMCALLFGLLSRNSFVVTHFIVPKQTGTSDSCNMMNEEELLEHQGDMVTLGWIHTHPSQTAFLSSIDLHTHYSYQQLLPEAIAIVCAPSYNQTGIFSLTADIGMNVITSCNLRGFHKHENERSLFEEVEHVKLDTSLSTSVIDLRS